MEIVEISLSSIRHPSFAREEPQQKWVEKTDQGKGQRGQQGHPRVCPESFPTAVPLIPPGLLFFVCPIDIPSVFLALPTALPDDSDVPCFLTNCNPLARRLATQRRPQAASNAPRPEREGEASQRVSGPALWGRCLETWRCASFSEAADAHVAGWQEQQQQRRAFGPFSGKKTTDGPGREAAFKRLFSVFSVFSN